MTFKCLPSSRQTRARGNCETVCGVKKNSTEKPIITTKAVDSEKYRKSLETELTKRDSSGTRERGDRSDRSSSDESGSHEETEIDEELIPRIDSVRMSTKRSTTTPLSRKRKGGSTMKQTRSDSINDEPRDDEPARPTLVGSGETGTTETENSTSEPNERGDSEGTRLMGSTEQYLTSVMVESPSMNLIDESNKHVFDSMKSLATGTDVRSIEVQAEKINAICNAAKNIRENMKLKLEVLKLQHEINRETGVYKK